MAEKINASLFFLEIEHGTPTATWKGISEETSHTVSISKADIGVTSKYNAGWEETIEGLMSGEASFEAIVDMAPPVNRLGIGDLFALSTTRGTIYNFRIRIDATQDKAFTFKGYLNKYELQAEMEDTAKVSLGLKITEKPVFANLV